MIARKSLRRFGALPWPLLLVSCLFPGACSAPGAVAMGGGTRVRAVHTLPELPLGTLLAEVLHRPVADDHGVLLGGAGSDLWRATDDPRDEFWMLCDRGPNGLVTIDNVARRTFLVPEFTPLILHVRARGAALELLAVLPLVGASGRPVTGISNLVGHDEQPWDATGTRELAYVPSGLDTEGLVRLADGSFWLAEEYGPSLVHVDAAGRVLLRLVPHGLAIAGADYAVADVLPAILAHRARNRGFEALALAPTGRTLYAFVQSPLLVPDKATGDASRNGRVLAVDVADGRTVAEYVYRFEPIDAFDPSSRVQVEMKVSSAVALADGSLLVGERTDRVARIFAADLTDATDVLGSEWDDPSQTPSLESLADPATNGVRPLSKRLVVDLAALPGVPGKIEGLAVVDDHTLAIANDNDFDVGVLDAAGRNIGKGVHTCIWTVSLDESLAGDR